MALFLQMCMTEHSTLRSILTHFQLTNLHKIHIECSPVCGLCSHQKSASWCTNWWNAGWFSSSTFLQVCVITMVNIEWFVYSVPLNIKSWNSHSTEIWQEPTHPLNIKSIEQELTVSWPFSQWHFYPRSEVLVSQCLSTLLVLLSKDLTALQSWALLLEVLS